MTSKETEQYNKLSIDERECYDKYKKKHPNWSHAQIMTMVVQTGNAEKVVSNNTISDPNDPRIQKEILRGTSDTLQREYPDIFEVIGGFLRKALSILDDIIDSIIGGVVNTVYNVGRAIGNIWDTITDWWDSL